MKKLLPIIVFFFAAFFFLATPTPSLAAPSANVTPNAPVIGEQITFTASGCPVGQEVLFTWTQYGLGGVGSETKIADASETATHTTSINTSASYTLTIKCNNTEAKKNFTVTNGAGQVSGDIRLQVPILLEGQSVVAGEPATVQAEGCNVGSVVQFVWDYSNSFASPNREGRVTVPANGLALYTTTYDVGTVYINATCDGKTSETFSFPVAINDNDNSPSPVPSTPVPPTPSICAEYDSESRCVKVNTAIGEISTDAGKFVIAIFSLILSMSGGIAIAIIIYAGYIYMTSRGNQERLTHAREMLVSALVGFLFIIFSLVIMTTLTGDILHIPGFELFRPECGQGKIC